MEESLRIVKRSAEIARLLRRAEVRERVGKLLKKIEDSPEVKILGLIAMLSGIISLGLALF